MSSSGPVLREGVGSGECVVGRVAVRARCQQMVAVVVGQCCDRAFADHVPANVHSNGVLGNSVEGDRDYQDRTTESRCEGQLALEFSGQHACANTTPYGDAHPFSGVMIECAAEGNDVGHCGGGDFDHPVPVGQSPDAEGIFTDPRAWGVDRQPYALAGRPDRRCVQAMRYSPTHGGQAHVCRTRHIRP